MEINPALPKVFHGISTKTWFFSHIFFNLLIILLIFINLILWDWVYQGQDQNKFQGNLIQIYNSGGKFELKSYSEIAEQMEYRTQNIEWQYQQDIYLGLYFKFQALYLGGIIMIFFALLSLVSFLLTFMGLILTYYKMTCRFLMVFSASLGWLFWWLGAISYILFSMSTSNSCQKYYSVQHEEDQINIVLEPACRGSAIYFMIFNMTIIPIFSVLICIFVCLVLKKEALLKDIEMDPELNIIQQLEASLVVQKKEKHEMEPNLFPTPYVEQQNSNIFQISGGQIEMDVDHFIFSDISKWKQDQDYSQVSDQVVLSDEQYKNMQPYQESIDSRVFEKSISEKYGYLQRINNYNLQRRQKISEFQDDRSDIISPQEDVPINQKAADEQEFQEAIQNKILDIQQKEHEFQEEKIMEYSGGQLFREEEHSENMDLEENNQEQEHMRGQLSILDDMPISARRLIDQESFEDKKSKKKKKSSK